MSAASASAPTLHLTSPISTPASSMRTIAQTCIVLLPPSVGRGAECPPTLVTALASDATSAQPSLCASRCPPARPRLGSRIDPPALPKAPDRSPSAIFCPHIAVPQAPAAKRVNPNPWRLTRFCTASGHAPAAQNCPRSRTRLTTWLRRFSGAANAAVGGVGSGGGGWKRDLENASLSRNLRATVRCF